MIASDRFRRWAARFPIVRSIAKRRARALFDLTAGFVYSQVLAACVRLKLFDLLKHGPLTVEALSGHFLLTNDATLLLLKAAASLDLAERLPDGRYGLGQLGAAVSGQPSLLAMIEHHAMLYADLADPVALLRGELSATQLSQFWCYTKIASPDWTTVAYSALMTKSQAFIANDVLDAFPLERFRALLDVGGGEGAFVNACATRYSNLRCVVFDLPSVAERAKKRFSHPLTDRVTVHGGDFFVDPLPLGADIVTLVRVLHDHDDDFVRLLLRRVRSALPKGGTLLVAEPLGGTRGAEPVGDAYFGFYLAAMGRGRPRTFGEIAALLREAGFCTAKLVPTAAPMVVSLISARAA